MADSAEARTDAAAKAVTKEAVTKDEAAKLVVVMALEIASGKEGPGKIVKDLENPNLALDVPNNQVMAQKMQNYLVAMGSTTKAFSQWVTIKVKVLIS